MTAISNTPVNKNFLSPLNFKFLLKRAPHVNFFIQKVNVPSIELSPPNFPNPMVNIPIPGEHLKYGILDISFKVDEDLQNYLEIHNWIKALGKPQDFEGYRNLEQQPQVTGDGIYSDITLTILSSTKMPNYEVNFADCHPVLLSGFQFNTVDTDVNYISADASFRYTYYDVVNI